MARFIQELDRIDYKNATGKAIGVGDVVAVGKMCGVAITDIANGDIGAVKVTGCFSVDAAAADTFAVGDTVYFDAAKKQASKTNTNPVLGVAISAKTASAKSVDVALWPNIE